MGIQQVTTYTMVFLEGTRNGKKLCWDTSDVAGITKGLTKKYGSKFVAGATGAGSCGSGLEGCQGHAEDGGQHHSLQQEVNCAKMCKWPAQMLTLDAGAWGVEPPLQIIILCKIL